MINTMYWGHPKQFMKPVRLNLVVERKFERPAVCGEL